MLKTSATKLCSKSQQHLNLDKSCQDSIMSKQNIQTFGETIRKLRESNDMPLRKLAALLDIDQSTLSKIERNDRRGNEDIINKLSKLFKIEKRELQICLLSDKLAYEVLDEEYGSEALHLAEDKIEYLKKLKD
jgi:transcriptional regulator with XRE-family HTH domain